MPFRQSQAETKVGSKTQEVQERNSEGLWEGMQIPLDYLTLIGHMATDHTDHRGSTHAEEKPLWSVNISVNRVLQEIRTHFWLKAAGHAIIAVNTCEMDFFKCSRFLKCSFLATVS